MRRFLIKSQAYNGEAELIYDDAGRLVKIDMMATDMAVHLVQAFKNKVPALVDSLQDAFADSKAIIVEGTFEVTFEMFWIAYAHKINKKRCELLWSRLSKVDQVAAWQGVAPYKKFLNDTEWRKQADPEKYIKERYWENEWK